MKQLISTITFCGLALLTLSCSPGSSSDSGGESTPAFNDTDTITQFADAVLLPTYADLEKQALALHEAIAALENDTSEANLTAAQQAWIATRAPWEKSEGFLFGPVDSNGYDPALDSWPVSHTDLETVLSNQNDYSSDFIQTLDGDKKGFHTIEFLLFGRDKSKQASDLNANEMAYLKALTENLWQTAKDLHLSWTEGVDGQPAYRGVFVTAGSSSTAYPSLATAGQEIINGMIGIADELANGKIGEPLESRDTTLVESQYAFNSLTDFMNNLRSLKNAYYGNYDGEEASHSISRYVASVKPELDSRVKEEIQAAMTSLDAVPEPFRDAILDDKARVKIATAQEAIRTLHDTLQQDVRVLFQ
jgi:predicted lipoprotein